MKSLDNIIQQLYSECVDDENIHDVNITPLDCLKECEKKNTLTQFEDFYIAFLKCKNGESNVIKMIFATKTGKKKSLNNEKIFKIIRSIEKNLIYVDTFHIDESDNYSYINLTKELN